MTDTSAQRSLLRRTKAHGESEMDGLAPEMALSKAILRSCDKDMDMHASAGQCKSALLSLPELLDGLPEKGLIATLDGADGALGLVCLEPETLSALVEQLTIGQVLPSIPELRRATRTDAALLGDWIGEILQGMVGELFEAAENPAAAIKATAVYDGYGFGRLITDPRPLALMLEDVSYQVLDVETAFGEVERKGRIMIAVLDRAPQPETENHALRAQEWREDLSATVTQAHAELNAVLHRMDIPIADLKKLTPGDVLSVPAQSIAEVSLEASDGTQVAISRLGQSMGLRAVRLSGPSATTEKTINEFADALSGSETNVPELPGPVPEGSDLEAVPVTDPPDLPKLTEVELNETSDISDLDGDLPALDDLPDLSDLPDLGGTDPSVPPAFAEEGTPSMLEDLPSLDDLPALDDFPALNDLPKIE